MFKNGPTFYDPHNDRCVLSVYNIEVSGRLRWRCWVAEPLLGSTMHNHASFGIIDRLDAGCWWWRSVRTQDDI